MFVVIIYMEEGNKKIHIMDNLKYCVGKQDAESLIKELNVSRGVSQN